MLTKFRRAFVIGGIAIFGISCATNPDVVFVSTDGGDLVRLGRDVRGHVYFWKGGSWVRSENKVLLPAGWYAGGLPRDMRPDNGDSAPED